MSKRITIYFRDGMKVVLDADKVAFVKNGVDIDSVAQMLADGKRVIRWESVNWVKEEVETDDAE